MQGSGNTWLWNGQDRMAPHEFIVHEKPRTVQEWYGISSGIKVFHACISASTDAHIHILYQSPAS